MSVYRPETPLTPQFAISSGWSRGWQIDRLIETNPGASVQVALMLGVVFGWLIKRR